jgi:hypothetical protein
MHSKIFDKNTSGIDITNKFLFLVILKMMQHNPPKVPNK